MKKNRGNSELTPAAAAAGQQIVTRHISRRFTHHATHTFARTPVSRMFLNLKLASNFRVLRPVDNISLILVTISETTHLISGFI